MFGKTKNIKKLDATMLAINTILREIYSNRSSDEYKMKGNIAKSPSYRLIETMLSDLATLKGYPKGNIGDLKELFKTLHLPVFKTAVKSYIMEPNDRNTIYTSMFTIGYRLLVGELSRIYSSTAATPSGIVYKPDKASRENDALKMIRLFNSKLETTLDKYIQDMKKNDNIKNETVNESFLMELFGLNVMTESDQSEVTQEDDTEAVVDDTASTDSSPEAETEVSDSDESVQEGFMDALTSFGKGVAHLTSGVSIVVAGASAIAGVLGIIKNLISGFNPIADVNYLFMNSYEKKIEKLDAVSRMYDETKKAYEEYMKIPAAQRKKKVESKYVQNMEKYNLAMKKLSAEIEHFNQRAKKESEEKVNTIENNMPSAKIDTPDESGKKPEANQDDDFQF